MIDASIDRGEQLVVNTAELCELVWVLGKAYGYSRDEIARALEQIFATAQFEVERLDERVRLCAIFAPRKRTSATH